jgi:hypothetical protein
MHDSESSAAPPDSGYRRRQALVRSVVQSPWTRVFLPVAAMYVLAAVGMSRGDSTVGLPFRFDQMLGYFQATGILLLFTASHAVMPVFIYGLALNDMARTREQTPASKPNAGGDAGRRPVTAGDDATASDGPRWFVYLHMALWFGLPTAVLGAMTSGVSLIGPVLAVALAPTGRRARAWVDYGSTSMALMLWALLGRSLFPDGLIVIPIQAALLGLTHFLMRDRTRETERS